jgi:hypothetical protein
LAALSLTRQRADIYRIQSTSFYINDGRLVLEICINGTDPTSGKPV